MSSSLVPWAQQAALPHLRQLLADLPGATGIILASNDGYELAKVGPEDLPELKLAGMASAIQGLGDAMSTASGLEDCRDIIVDSHAGRIVIMSIPEADPGLVLMAVVAGQIAFGQLLLQCRNCAVAIGNETRRQGSLTALQQQTG